jgi:hypothetical protein
MLLIKPAAATPCVNEPVLFAVEQLSAVMVPKAKTFLVKVQVCPPMFNAKLAVPVISGVPVIIYVKLPAPLAKLPAVKEAVKPVTPVEVIVCVVYVPPFPPVYGILLLALAAAMPCVNVPVLVAVEQVSADIVPTGRSTVLVKVHVCPPMLRAKLAVPLVAGVPVIV